jgi:hypothetical protein
MRVLLAEATVHGLDREEVTRRCEAILAGFASGERMTL